ncbi:MAG: hypothetical protein KKH77_02040, partial [Candidatus Omnitrophica bacterium]|nr:hypothetical protein [Candidatus Omnitrophota bacterium]
SFDVAQKDDGKAILIQHEGETLAEVPLATDLAVDKNTILSGLTRFLDSRKEFLPPHAKDAITQLTEKISNVDAIVALKHHKDVKGAFYETNDQYTLYLSEGILNNLLGLIHELSEGVITLPSGYRNLTRHTMMRGVGKDVRNALDVLGSESASKAKTAGDLIRMLEQVMEKEDFAMSNNRSRDSPIMKSEKDLILWNYENARSGRELLFGIQDFLSIEGNAKFTQGIRNLNRDLRQGVLNIFLMRSKIDTKSAETAVGRKVGRKLEKNLGVNTQILYFEDDLGEQLTKAVKRALAPENNGKLPKIFVDCLIEDDWKKVNDFKDSKRQEFSNIDDIIAIGKDFMEGQEPNELPDSVKVILVGSVIMNDRRLKDDFKMSPEDLLESRRRTIDFLMSNEIIDKATIANDQIDAFFNDIWKGIKRLLITRINWKEFQDRKNNQDEVMRSL